MSEVTEAYMIDGKKLFRKGEQIGTLEGDVLTIDPEHKQYKAAVTRWLSSQSEKAEEAEKAKAEGEAPEPEKPKKKGPDADEEELAAMTAEARKDSEKSRAIYKDDVAFATAHKLPEPPKKNPQFGDKTPAFVEWLAKYRPDEFKRRYGIKGKGQVPVIERNSDGIDEVTGYKTVDMANRKVHLTEKIETARGLSEDMDWDA